MPVVIALQADCIKLAFIHAATALDALILMNKVGLLPCSGYGVDRADPDTGHAADTIFVVNHIIEQVSALARPALLINRMLPVLLREVVQRGEDRIGRSLSQSTQRCILDYIGEVVELLQILAGPLSVTDPLQDLVETSVPDTARGTLSARLLHDEVEVEFCNGDHAVIFIEYDHSTRAHHGACSRQALVINGRIQMLFGQTPTGGSAGLYRLEPLAPLDATAYLVDNFTKCNSHWHLDQSHIVDLPGKRKHL